MQLAIRKTKRSQAAGGRAIYPDSRLKFGYEMDDPVPSGGPGSPEYGGVYLGPFFVLSRNPIFAEARPKKLRPLRSSVSLENAEERAWRPTG